jgi:hypothetical protein
MEKQKPPENQHEFDLRYHQRALTTGFGAATTMNLPCPFCAAPGFAAYKVLQVKEEMAKEHVCTECGRGAKAIFTPQNDGGLHFEIVQTRGDDPPDWMASKPRRVT